MTLSVTEIPPFPAYILSAVPLAGAGSFKGDKVKGTSGMVKTLLLALVVGGAFACAAVFTVGSDSVFQSIGYDSSG